MSKQQSATHRSGMIATSRTVVFVCIALAVAGCSSSSAVGPSASETSPSPQDVPALPSAPEAPLNDGVSDFVLAVVPRTWFAAANTISMQSCMEQLEDGGQFYNALPGVGGNPPPSFGSDGDRRHREFLPKLKTSIEAMGPWCSALGREADRMVFPDTRSPSFLDQIQLQMDTLFAVRRNYPRVSDGYTYAAGVYCEQSRIDSSLSANLYQAFVLEQEQKTRRLIARDPSFGDAFRQGGSTIEQAAAEYVRSLFQSPTGLHRYLC